MMASIRWTATKLAIFTVVTVIVTLWLASIIGNLRPFSSPYELRAEFSDATGLLAGDVVKAAGVTVGRVQSIEIDDGIAVVTMSVDEGVELPAGLTAQIRFRNLVGQRMVTLVDDDTASGVTEGGDMIPLERTEAAFDLTVLFNGLRPIIRSTSPKDINIVTHAVVEALEGRSDEVEGFLGNVASISETLASKDVQLQTMLDSLNIVTSDLAGRDEQLQRTLANLADFLTDISANREELDQALVTLDDAATRLGRIVERNDETIRGEVRDLATLLDAVSDKKKALRQAVASLPEMVVSVERVSTYGEWSNIHLIHLCKDDFGTCGGRWVP